MGSAQTSETVETGATFDIVNSPLMLGTGATGEAHASPMQVHVSDMVAVESDHTMASSEGDNDGYQPRKRASSRIAELDSMVDQQQTNVNVLAPFPQVAIKSWAEFDTILNSYTKAKNLHFRVRSSESSAKDNMLVF